MSERDRFGRRLQSARLAGLVHASRLFAEAGSDSESLSRSIAEYVARIAGDACTVRLLSPDGSQFLPAAAHHPDDTIRAAIREMMRTTTERSRIGLWRTVIEDRQTVWIRNTEQLPAACSEDQAAFIRAHHVSEFMAAPMIASGRVIGGIALIRFAGSPPHSEADEVFLGDLAERAALTIDNGRLYAEARAHLETLRALVENAPDIISRFDRDLRHLYVNPAVESATGLPASAMVGKSGLVGLPEPIVAFWEQALRRVFRSGQELTVELTYPTPRGERHYQSRIAPELGPDGTVRTVLVIARDITDQHAAALERADMLRQLLDRDRRLQELVSRLLLDRESDRKRAEAVARVEPMTPREREIVRLVAAGQTNQQIARQLGLSSGTVKNHVARLLDKLGVEDRTAAAVRAVHLGLIESA